MSKEHPKRQSHKSVKGPLVTFRIRTQILTLLLIEKNRVKLSHDQDSYVNTVFKEWLPNIGMARVLKNCFPLAKVAAVPRTLDSWALGLLEKSSHSKVENEDKRLVKLSKKLHLATGPLF